MGNIIEKSITTPEVKYFDRYLKKEIFNHNKKIPNDEIFEINLISGGGSYLKNKEKLFNIKYKIEEILKK